MVKLALFQPHRSLTLLERLLLGITCIGFCAGATPEGIADCHRFCLPKRQFALGKEIKQLSQ